MERDLFRVVENKSWLSKVTGAIYLYLCFLECCLGASICKNLRMGKSSARTRNTIVKWVSKQKDMNTKMKSHISYYKTHKQRKKCELVWLRITDSARKKMTLHPEIDFDEERSLHIDCKTYR